MVGVIGVGSGEGRLSHPLQSGNLGLCKNTKLLMPYISKKSLGVMGAATAAAGNAAHFPDRLKIVA